MRVYNFSAGPATLPESVLTEVQQELLNFHGQGLSIMEQSHRAKMSDDYAVLFLQGGATGQFSLIPQNICQPTDKADYVISGQWSKKSVAHAKEFVNVNVAADSTESKFTTITPQADWSLSADAEYLHFCDNETVHGVEFPELPQSDKLLVSDMSSNILSRQFDVSKFGIVYAGAQKNIGPAGLTIVIVRKDLLEREGQKISPVFNYKTMAAAGSMSNTPPTFAWYTAGKVFEWLKDLGGVTEIEKRNAAKSKLLYDTIDASSFYANPVDKAYRSRMNIPFTLANAELDALFLEKSAEQGMINLKGHRSVGGMRASLYNPMPLAGVQKLVDFMQIFEKENA